MDCLRTLKWHSEMIKCLIKIKNNLFASGGFDSSLTLWEFGGNCIKIFSPKVGFVLCLMKLNNHQIMYACGKYLNILDISC